LFFRRAWVERQERAEAESRQIMLRLRQEEDQLRREHPDGVCKHHCECTVAMQQQKIAAIDEANTRILEDLRKGQSALVSHP